MAHRKKYAKKRRGGRKFRRNPRHLSVPEKHQLKIAISTLKMSDAGARIMGGMTKAEARAVIRRLTGRVIRENPPRQAGCLTALKALLKLATTDPTRYDSVNPYSRPQVKLAMKFLARMQGWDENKDKSGWLQAKYNNPRRTRYELFYSTGGHGGPYYSLKEARSTARRLLSGNRSERSIEIRASDFKTVIQTIRKKK